MKTTLLSLAALLGMALATMATDMTIYLPPGRSDHQVSANVYIYNNDTQNYEWTSVPLVAQGLSEANGGGATSDGAARFVLPNGYDHYISPYLVDDTTGELSEEGAFYSEEASFEWTNWKDNYNATSGKLHFILPQSLNNHVLLLHITDASYNTVYVPLSYRAFNGPIYSTDLGAAYESPSSRFVAWADCPLGAPFQLVDVTAGKIAPVGRTNLTALPANDWVPYGGAVAVPVVAHISDAWQNEGSGLPFFGTYSLRLHTADSGITVPVGSPGYLDIHPDTGLGLTDPNCNLVVQVPPGVHYSIIQNVGGAASQTFLGGGGGQVVNCGFSPVSPMMQKNLRVDENLAGLSLRAQWVDGSQNTQYSSVVMGNEGVTYQVHTDPATNETTIDSWHFRHATATVDMRYTGVSIINGANGQTQPFDGTDVRLQTWNWSDSFLSLSISDRRWQLGGAPLQVQFYDSSGQPNSTPYTLGGTEAEESFTLQDFYYTMMNENEEPVVLWTSPVRRYDVPATAFVGSVSFRVVDPNFAPPDEMPLNTRHLEMALPPGAPHTTSFGMEHWKRDLLIFQPGFSPIPITKGAEEGSFYGSNNLFQSKGTFSVTTSKHTGIPHVFVDVTGAAPGAQLNFEYSLVWAGNGEIIHLTQPGPARPGASNNDRDGDGIPNGWEVNHGLDPGNPTDALADSDGDGLKNGEEYAFGTDPNDADSDDDGMNDFDQTFNTQGAFTDSDTDGISDWMENALGLNTYGGCSFHSPATPTLHTPLE